VYVLADCRASSFYNFVFLLQIIDGIDQSAWNSDPMIVQSFQQAVAQSCEDEGVLYNDVWVTAVITSPHSILLPQSAQRTLRSADTQASTSSVLVAYLIQQEIQNFFFSYNAVTNISSSLTTAVEEGYFTAYLQGFAAANGANALLAASSSTIDVLSDTPVPSSAPVTKSHSSKLSSGSIAAIAVCCSICTIVFCLLLCCSAREEISRAPVAASEAELSKLNPTAAEQGHSQSNSEHKE
jgi:hypothetical protein